MKCALCGKEARGDDVFCAACTRSLGLTTATAVAEPPADPAAGRMPYPPARRKKRRRHPLAVVLTALCALSLLVLALFVGAYYDTYDPLHLRQALWPDGGYNSPPAPDGLLSLDGPPLGLTPPVTPVSRGAPLWGDRANACLLLEAAISLDAGLSANVMPPGEALTGFLWQALRAADPFGRFDQTPDGYAVLTDDLDDLCRETLGRVPADGPFMSLLEETPGERGGFAAMGDGWEWRDDLMDDNWRIDIYDWSPRPDGSALARFNVLYTGMLYDSFERQGEAILSPNELPVYYRYHLVSLGWNEPGRFKPARIAASSSLRGLGGESYTPNNLIDGDPATAWVAGESGEARLELALGDNREVTGLTVVNGFCKNAESMRQYSRVKQFRLECAGFAAEFELEDVPDYHTGGDWQSFTFGRAVRADSITITILSLYGGTASDGACLGEIELF